MLKRAGGRIEYIRYVCLSLRVKFIRAGRVLPQTRNAFFHVREEREFPFCEQAKIYRFAFEIRFDNRYCLFETFLTRYLNSTNDFHPEKFACTTQISLVNPRCNVENFPSLILFYVPNFGGARPKGWRAHVYSCNFMFLANVTRVTQHFGQGRLIRKCTDLHYF